MIFSAIISSISSLGALITSVMLLLAFWRLHLFSSTPAARIGAVASLLHLLIWLFYGLLWIVSAIPGDLWMSLQFIYEFPILFEIIWLLGTLSLGSALLAMAWVLHHGVTPPALPGDT
ncbi:hypothetical protein [Haloferula rosea]|uniref:Uncharacterized protein n=1 Tax=Haloferula rosea TaxID=490093 RepID=A0A934RFJ2_9BACT|nr:hypothetical protein [Haloferula rosea]MBK1828249.1 hypothetical protein [Haloferula rosea]